jgi:hypothetical protein
LTTVEVSARRGQWLRAIGYGLLAEIATIVTIIALVMLNRHVIATGRTDAEYAMFGMHIGGIVGVIGGTLYTFLFARLLMRRVSSRFVEHGIVVALAAIALSIAGSIAGHQGVPSGYLLASALKIAAGAFAGFLSARGSVREP